MTSLAMAQVTIPVSKGPDAEPHKYIHTTMFQLLQWKHALSLESKGLKLSRGRSVAAHLRRELELPRTVKPEALRAIVVDIMAQVEAQAAAA